MAKQTIRFLLRSGLLAALLLIIGTLFFEPVPVQASDNNILWDSLGHDSRDLLYRSPGGAVTTGTSIRLRLRAADGDLTGASVRVWNDRLDTSTIYPMARVATNVALPNDPGPYEFWEVTLPASAVPTVYWYRFIATDGSATAYYEDDDARTGGWGQTYGSSPDNSWQLTIYDSGFTTPDWVKNAVIYQIFPDRFRDGDPNNNPTAGEFFYGNFDTIVRSNGTDWNTHICDPRAAAGSGSTCPDKYSQNFYGGDLQGIIDQMAYIDSLGVTALYLNPIFQSPSNHRYDTIDFFQIDPRLGTLTDFQNLVAAADSYGIKIILDGVFNHSSSDSIYFDRYDRWNATSSSPADPVPVPVAPGTSNVTGACETNNPATTDYVNWYTFFNYTGTGSAPCSDNRDYPKWFGIFDSLPVLQHDYPPVRDYFINDGLNAVGPYWIAQGADGWRLDVAPEVDHGTINDPSDDYWEDFRTAVHAQNPDTYIVGEEWGNPTSWTIGGEWDATMNYQFSSSVLSFWRDTTYTDNDFNSGSSAGALNPIAPSALNERLSNLEERYAEPAFYAMMNLFGSHDTNRLLVLLNHGPNSTADFNNPAYDWSDAIQRAKGAALMQMTMPGAPTIYYGDEVGTVNPPAFDGSTLQDDPYNRVPYPWLDETGTPYYTHMQSAGGERGDLLAYYQTLTSIRANNPALRTGSFDPLLIDDANDVFAYGRQMADDSNTAIVIANGSSVARSVTVNVAGYYPGASSLSDPLNGGFVQIDANGDLTVNVPARSGAVLVSVVPFTGARPACVTDLATTPASNRADLSWSATTNADSYDIYRSQISGGGYVYIDNTSNTTYTDTTVSNATTYYYTLVAKNDGNLLTSDLGCGNESAVTPTLSITWANLQWPPDIGNGNTPQPTYELSANTPTTEIYGQVYIAGETDTTSGQVPGVTAQVGYGPAGVAPSDAQWAWFPMSFNGEAVNNDEYVGTLLPTAAGTFRYTTRWSTDGGTSWTYTDQVSPPYDEADSGLLVVSNPSDTTAPDAPTNLAVLATSSTSITLGWDAHPNTDGDLYGFNIYRDSNLIDTIEGAALTQYVDTTVTNGANYDYYITAVDESLNESLPSNTVNATAEILNVQVTFSVSVPDPSPGTVHIVGNFNGWDPGDPNYAMTEASPGVWEITLTMADESSIEYKYTRGSWETVEKEADGNAEIGNRNHTASYGTTGEETVNNTVLNWRDPLVTIFSPEDSATDVLSDTTIDLTWNQAMPDDVSSGVAVTGPGGAISGVWGTTGDATTSQFTPDSALADGTYTVNVSGATDIAGDVQQSSQSASFTVGTGQDTTPPTAPTNLAITNSSSTQVDLTWDAHPDNAGDLASFGVWRSDNGAPATQIDTVNNPAATSYSDTTVTNGTNYDYYLTASDTNGNASDPSNTVSTTTPLGVAIDWANLQFPTTITHTANLVTPTSKIYGQVYVAGYTGGQNGVDPTPGLIAEIGYGADGTLPTDVSWQWFETGFNINVGNNDEFVGDLVIANVGSYDYLYRYSTDGGQTWVYGTIAGPISNLVSYNAADAGQLTVNPSGDTTPPAAPTNLSVSAESNTAIDLAWDAHPNIDGDLYGFEIYREDTSAPGYALLDTLVNPAATTYSDTSVVTGTTYNYYLVAIDTSANASADSNVVQGTARTLADVTFSVTVPDHTPGTVYVAGNFDNYTGSPYPAWDAAGIALSESSPNVWEVTLTAVPDGTVFEYKYTRGSWETVEKEADGNADILSGGDRGVTANGNTTQTDTVANWRDPYVTAITPADSAVVLPGATIQFTWNQDMPEALAGTATVTHDVDGAISGTLSYDSGTDTHTFTPDATLAVGTVTVDVSGNSDVAGDTQQVATSNSFNVTDITFANLQWPPTLTFDLITDTETETVYGQIYIPGLTDASASVVAGVTAQVGYGDDGTSPDDASWVWLDMVPNPGYDFTQNNDEYQGTMQPDTIGDYDYVVRYSTDGGTTWVYGAYNNTFYADLTAYDAVNAGQLTVTANTVMLSQDEAVAEGDSGQTDLVFTVTASEAVSGNATVDYAVTGSGTHPADAADFVGAVLPSGTATINTGLTSTTISIPINGDTDLEFNETFTLTLSNPSANILLDVDQSTGTILADDDSDNMLTNPDFAADLSGWSFWGSIDYTWVSGVLSFFNTAGNQDAVVFQTVNQVVPAGMPLETTLDLTNNSPQGKQFNVRLRTPDWSEQIACTVLAPPDMPTTSFTLRGVTTSEWASVMVTINTSDRDDNPELLLDNVSLQMRPSLTVSGIECTDLGGTPTDTNLLLNPRFESGLQSWGVFGSVDWNIQDNTLELYRTDNTQIAALYQFTGYPVPADAQLTFSVDMSNTSNVEKTVRLMLRDNDWSPIITSESVIPANAPMNTYTLQTITTQPWNEVYAIVRVESADNLPAIEIDNTSLVYTEVAPASIDLDALHPEPFIVGETIDVIVRGAVQGETYALDCDGDGLYETAATSTQTQCLLTQSGMVALSGQITAADDSTRTTSIMLEVLSVDEALALLGLEGQPTLADLQAYASTSDDPALVALANRVAYVLR